MTNELEVKGLDACFEEGDFIDPDFSIIEFHQLCNLFQDLDLMLPQLVISIIHQYCKPGTVYIHTQDGGEIDIRISVLALSKVLSIQAEVKPFEPIHLRKVSAHIFCHIKEYLTHHNGVKPAEIAKPIRSIDMYQCVKDPWDAEFANSLTKRELFLLTVAANYIDCQSLLHLMCAKIAILIKGKNPDEIKIILSERDAAEADNIIEQKQLSVCSCGYVWDEVCEELKEEADQEVLEETNENVLSDGQEQQFPLLNINDGSSVSSVDINIGLEDEVPLKE